MSTAVAQTESGPQQPATADRAKSWIISPLWDVVFLIAAPLAIVPLVTLTATHLLDIEEISLVVISFATFGHHLPGFLRAYGDRDLFGRFRARFLWAPPLVFAVALFSAAQGFHGLSLILLFWATWHGLMQTYGFMRIYDLKQGLADRQGARFDFLLCLVIFTAGLVFSDARVYGIADILAKTGVPLPGPAWLSGARWALGSLVVVVIAAYLWHIAARVRRGAPLAWPRMALGLSTGWLYWLGGVLATDMLVGVATFEIFHALQYDAIVWAYNRGKARKTGALTRPLGALFQQSRPAGLALYVALIAAFSSIRLMGEVSTSTWIQRGLIALLTTSTFMHFYFDGFIWKVSDRKTQDDLAIAERANWSAPRRTWRPSHALFCTLLALMAGGLIFSESRREVTAQEQTAELDQLTALTPALPELQWRVSEAALAGGDTQRAVDMASAAVQLRPHSQQAHARLGAALLAAGRPGEASEELQTAARLGSRRSNNHSNLGIALGQLGQWEESAAAFQRAADLAPRDAAIRASWARMCERAGARPAAIEHYRAALALDPTDDQARASLVLLLSGSAQHDEAINVAHGDSTGSEVSAARQLSLGKALVAAGKNAEAIVALAPLCEVAGAESDAQRARAATACYETAVAQMQLGHLSAAAQRLDQALALDPQSSLAHFQLGNLQHARGEIDAAAQSYRRSLDLQPDFAPAHGNLGSVLMVAGDSAHARSAFERALVIDPHDGSTHYNLGLLLLNENRDRDARAELFKARELGVPLPPKLEVFLESLAP